MSSSDGKTEPIVAGMWSEHPAAGAFASEVMRVHHRYASEVVGAFSLCPFMRDPQTAFGVFCVMLETDPSLEAALEQIRAATTSVVHLVYPLVGCPPRQFEQFGNAIHEELARSTTNAPVHATFHPQMDGGRQNAGRLVGLLRHAPDPFVQIVPAGLHEGGTVFIDSATLDLNSFPLTDKTPTESNFERLDAKAIDSIESLQRNIRDDRDDAYAPFVQQFG